ncbi:MAG: hypothetical protein K5650_02250 [Bacteroidales bacterium]|nr:hypothetical protein [Bacteroidales bacterium]
MPFVAEILKHRSLSIVGLDKNTGKTVCLNYLLRRLNQLKVEVAVTSIGVDGEQTDAVFATAKPEITLYEGTTFITSELHYRQRQLLAEIVDVDEQRTSLGRLVTARALTPGKVLLSGAATTEKLRRQIQHFDSMGVGLTVVDGALSRLSLASPTVTEALILATGAVVSPNIQQLIIRTRYACRLIALPEVDTALKQRLSIIESGLWGVDDEGVPHDLQLQSVFLLDSKANQLFAYGSTIFVSGAVSDRLLKVLAAHPQCESTTLIVRDFTKLFITLESYTDFTRRGGKIRVLQQSKLVAVCLNPTSPHGYRINSDDACKALSQALEMPVYDVMRPDLLKST